MILSLNHYIFRAYNEGKSCCSKNTERNKIGMGSNGPGLRISLGRHCHLHYHRHNYCHLTIEFLSGANQMTKTCIFTSHLRIAKPIQWISEIDQHSMIGTADNQLNQKRKKQIGSYGIKQQHLESTTNVKILFSNRCL